MVFIKLAAQQGRYSIKGRRLAQQRGASGRVEVAVVADRDWAIRTADQGISLRFGRCPTQADNVSGDFVKTPVGVRPCGPKQYAFRINVMFGGFGEHQRKQHRHIAVETASFGDEAQQVIANSPPEDTIASHALSFLAGDGKLN
jgi:hypothetical protein